MIDIREATVKAERYARELFAPEELKYLRLEEVEFSETDNLWRITLGWVDPAVSGHQLLFGGVLGDVQSLPRLYKVFHVRADSGDVVAMKIRQVESHG